MKNINASLYIHIPFCDSKCDYCDFYSIEINRGGHGGFLDVLIREINEQVERFKVKSIPTVYIGGGTPSVLGADIKILFDALKKIPNFSPAEFTIEANPESLTEEFCSVCNEGGVTRLSLGVQTFYEPSRLAVNRAGDCAVVEKALRLAKDYFPHNLSADLITGFPYQTKEIVLDDIKRLLDFDPAHVSVYSLTLEKKTLLYNKIQKGLISLPCNELSDKLWLASRDALLKAGFKHYEVSNFARKGCECKHNIRYWRMENWLGIGPSASGTIIDEKNCTAKRYNNKGTGNREQVTWDSEQIAINREELIREIILMGYRYCEGPDPKRGIEKLIPNSLEKWKDKDKMLFLNSFLLDAFSELGK